MLRSSTSPCCSYVKSALNCAPLGLNFDFGAPGQSTLKSGLAMSVTRSLYFSRIRRASAISLASRFRMFLFHIPRSSIHSMPNSCAATSQARPKSGTATSYRQSQFFLKIFFVGGSRLFGAVRVFGHRIQFHNHPAAEIDFAQRGKHRGNVHQALPQLHEAIRLPRVLALKTLDVLDVQKQQPIA